MSHAVEIFMFGRNFTILTGENEDIAQAAATLVQKHIDELRQMGTTVASDRLMLLVALNLAGELIKQQKNSVDDIEGLISDMDSVILQAESLANAPLR